MQLIIVFFKGEGHLGFLNNGGKTVDRILTSYYRL